MQLYQYLQQLPLSSQDGIDLPPSEKEKALQMVWQGFLEGDFQQRWEVAKYLPKFGESVIARLTQLLQAETVEVDLRCEAAAILGQIKASRALLALTEMLNPDTDPEVLTACSNALTQKGKSAIPILTAALTNPETRDSAVRALANLRTPETIAPLMQVVDDANPEIRRTAVEALSSFRDPQVVSILVKALQDTHPQVRQEAVIACGTRGQDQDPETVVSALIPLLYDLNLDICGHCAIALGKLGTATAIQALAKGLNSTLTPFPLQQKIIRSLSYQENEQTLSVLIDSLWRQPLAVQREIITIVGRWGDPDSKSLLTTELMQFFQESPEAQANPSLKQSLALTLGNLGVITAKPLLLHLKEDETPKVRLHAQAALKKLP